MTTYTNVFGGTVVYPSEVSYRAVTLTADTQLSWPTELATDTDVVAQIMDVTANAGPLKLKMPSAIDASVGETTLIFNVGSNAFTVTDTNDNTIVSIAPGLAYQLYLTDNTTASGSWRSVQYGAGTSSATAGSLAGQGIKAIGTTLNQSMSVFTFSVNYSLGVASDRSALYVWTGGAGTISLPLASDAGNDWFVQVRNGGTGALTVDPAGVDLINGSSSLVLNPGDSAIIACSGSAWFTIGLGKSASFTFDYNSINLTGQPDPYTLAGANLNRIAYNFGGTLTANFTVIVPTTIQQYWVTNSTSGGFNITVKTASGTGIIIAAGEAAILYCDGVNVVEADTGGVAFPISVANGGTGATTATDARTNLSAAKTGINSDITSITALSAGGASGPAVTFAADPDSGMYSAGANQLGFSVNGVNAMTLTTSGMNLANALSVANGGTGTSTAFTTGSIVFAGASGVYSQDNANLFWDDTNNRLGVGTASPTEKLDISGGAGNSSVSVQVDSVNPVINLKADATSGFYPAINFYGAGASGGLVSSIQGYDGVYLEAAGNRSVVLRTNGSERLRVNGSGNVGIGTSSPNSFAGYTYITTAGTNGSGIYFRQGATDLGLVDVYANAMHVFSQGAHPLALGTNNTERMRIDSSGNVGIGTSSPTATLEAAKTSGDASLKVNANSASGASYVFISAGNNASGSKYAYTRFYNYDTGGGDWRIGTYGSDNFSIFDAKAASERMRITSAGNVGIGTSTPDANGKVDILGNIDPGTTPAALSVRNTGVVGGTAAAQYGIRVSSQTYNNATASYGIYAFSYQNVGNATYGIWGDAGSAATGGTSFAPWYGVVGRAYNNSDLAHTLTTGQLPVGVYGTVVSNGSASVSISAAGYFTNTSTFGSESYGIYVNVATGPTTTIAARFDFAGAEVARIDSAGGILSRGTGGIGYRTGAGGTVTQVTSRTTGVTINKTTGSITLVSAAGTATWQSFTVTNSTVAINDTVIVNQRSGTDLYLIHVTNVAAGSFRITFATTGGTTTEQPVFNFAVIKGATS